VLCAAERAGDFPGERAHAEAAGFGAVYRIDVDYTRDQLIAAMSQLIAAK